MKYLISVPFNKTLIL